MKGEGSSELGELTQQGAGRDGDEGDVIPNVWGSRSRLVRDIYRQPLKFWEMLFLLREQDFPGG